MRLATDTKWVLFAAGLIFLWSLLLGVWKFRQMAASPEGRAHFYVDTAHRAALLYSFATMLLAAFVEFSAWSTAVNLIAAFAVIAFFAGAIAAYSFHGYARDTDNQFRDPSQPGLHGFMWALIVVEIGGFGVLLAGFADAQLF
jgi:cobalamin synthase